MASRVSLRRSFVGTVLSGSRATDSRRTPNTPARLRSRSSSRFELQVLKSNAWPFGTWSTRSKVAGQWAHGAFLSRSRLGHLMTIKPLFGAIGPLGFENSPKDWRAFCEAMLDFYTDMSYIDHEDVSENTLAQGLHLIRPIRNDLGMLDQSTINDLDDSNIADALLGSVAKNIFCAVRAHALLTLLVVCSRQEGNRPREPRCRSAGF